MHSEVTSRSVLGWIVTEVEVESDTLEVSVTVNVTVHSMTIPDDVSTVSSGVWLVGSSKTASGTL